MHILLPWYKIAGVVMMMMMMMIIEPDGIMGVVLRHLGFAIPSRSTYYHTMAGIEGGANGLKKNLSHAIIYEYFHGIVHSRSLTAIED